MLLFSTTTENGPGASASTCTPKPLPNGKPRAQPVALVSCAPKIALSATVPDASWKWTTARPGMQLVTLFLLASNAKLSIVTPAVLTTAITASKPRVFDNANDDG